jgi:hypothetical protein
MNSATGSPEIGQWYERADSGTLFQVTGLDEAAGTVEIQSFDGDVGEIEARIWSGLPLERVQLPEDGLGPAEEMEAQDLAFSQAETLLANPRALEQLAELGSGNFI